MSALDQVVRGAEMVSDRDTAQPGSCLSHSAEARHFLS